MGLKNYDVEINGQQTTLQLSDEDAKLYGLKASDAATAAEAKEKAAPANKAAKQPTNKQADAASQALGH